jgi:hypothetical protein
LERKRWLLDHEKQAITGGTTSTVSRKTDRQDGTMRLFF